MTSIILISSIADSKQSSCDACQTAIEGVVFFQKNWLITHPAASADFSDLPRQLRVGQSYKLSLLFSYISANILIIKQSCANKFIS